MAIALSNQERNPRQFLPALISSSTTITGPILSVYTQQSAQRSVLTLVKLGVTWICVFLHVYLAFSCLTYRFAMSDISESTYPESTAGPTSPVFGTASFSTFTTTALTSLWPSSSNRSMSSLLFRFYCF